MISDKIIYNDISESEYLISNKKRISVVDEVNYFNKASGNFYIDSSNARSIAHIDAMLQSALDKCDVAKTRRIEITYDEIDKYEYYVPTPYSLRYLKDYDIEIDSSNKCRIEMCPHGVQVKYSSLKLLNMDKAEKHIISAIYPPNGYGVSMYVIHKVLLDAFMRENVSGIGYEELPSNGINGSSDYVLGVVNGKCSIETKNIHFCNEGIICPTHQVISGANLMGCFLRKSSCADFQCCDKFITPRGEFVFRIALSMYSQKAVKIMKSLKVSSILQKGLFQKKALFPFFLSR